MISKYINTKGTENNYFYKFYKNTSSQRDNINGPVQRRRGPQMPQTEISDKIPTLPSSPHPIPQSSSNVPISQTTQKQITPQPRKHNLQRSALLKEQGKVRKKDVRDNNLRFSLNSSAISHQVLKLSLLGLKTGKYNK